MKCELTGFLPKLANSSYSEFSMWLMFLVTKFVPKKCDHKIYFKWNLIHLRLCTFQWWSLQTIQTFEVFLQLLQVDINSYVQALQHVCFTETFVADEAAHCQWPAYSFSLYKICLHSNIT